MTTDPRSSIPADPALRQVWDRGYQDGLRQVRYIRAPYPAGPEGDAYAAGYEHGSAAAEVDPRGSRERPGQPVSQKGAVTGTIETPTPEPGVIERAGAVAAEAGGAVVAAVGTGITSGVTALVAGAVVLGGTALAIGIFSKRRRQRKHG